jgi:hypothetical protein
MARASNGDIAWYSSKFFIENAFKTRIRHLVQQSKLLQA